jgi:hypothetical protein
MSINDKVEDICYFNKDIYTIDNYIPESTLTSVENFRYSNRSSYPLIDFLKDNKFREINKYLRGINNKSEYINLINEFNDFIVKSPVLTKPFVVYRGLDVKLDVKLGDILRNLGFIFASLDRKSAEFYLQNTANCYQNYGNDVGKAIKSLNGKTLFKINIPSGTHFIDSSYYDHSIQYLVSEIIFSKDITLKVIDIIEEHDTVIIEAVLVDGSL